MQIIDLPITRIDEFMRLFNQIMMDDWKEYSLQTRRYFLEQMYPRDVIIRFITYKLRKILVTIEDDRIIGFLMGDNTYGGVGFLSWIGVEQAFRNKGIGTKMIDEYISFCKSKGAHMIELYTFPKTVEFYTKIGFKEIGRREKGYFQVVNIIMDKDI